MNQLKLDLLGFMESKGAFSSDGQAHLPGGNFVDLNEFLQARGVDRAKLEDLVQEMRASWQMGALWFNNQWLAFYTQIGHDELNRLRGTSASPPGGLVAKPMFLPQDAAAFWRLLQDTLTGQGQTELAGQINLLATRPEVLNASQQAFAHLRNK